MDRRVGVFGKLTGMRRITTALLVMSGAAWLAAHQVDVARLGPQVGDRVTDFRLTDQHGQAKSIASAAGPKGTMLVFFRSADW
jgi:hypothetical protein